MTTFAYIRVSTRAQAEGGWGLGAQRSAIEQATDEPIEWVEDAGISARSLDRPGLQHLLATIERGDVLVVAKLARLARSAIDFLRLVEQSNDEGWELRVLDLGLDGRTPMGRFSATLLAALAQLEREMIGERTREGLAVAKANGVPLGRPSSLPREVRDTIHDLRDSGLTQAKTAERLNSAGISAAAGGEWTRQGVGRVLKAGRPD